jgi:hypothetical protein
MRANADAVNAHLVGPNKITRWSVRIESVEAWSCLVAGPIVDQGLSGAKRRAPSVVCVGAEVGGRIGARR